MSLVGFQAQNHPQQPVRDDVDDRGTTPEMFEPLNERFGFTLDVAAAAHNAKCARYFTREQDGLTRSWAGERVWCNPPYSGIGAWVQKAWDEWNGVRSLGLSGAMQAAMGDAPPPAELIVMLLPANRTEQSWWMDLVEPHRDREGSPLRVEFLRGRPRFIRPNAVIGPKGDRPPFGCCLLVWEGAPSRRSVVRSRRRSRQ